MTDIKQLSGIITFICLSLLISCSEDKESPSHPNIILIYTDDLGYGDISPFHPKENITPNLHQLAKEGTVLTNFYVASSVCSPSRASLLTGSYPVRVGIPGNLAPSRTSWAKNVWRHGLNPEEETIADLLKEKGYATALIGKWHLGHAKEHLPMNHGFDRFYGIPYSNDMYPREKLQYPPLPLISNEIIIEENPDQRFFTKNFTNETLNFFTEHQDQPFFVLLTHPMPHVPLSTSPDFENKTGKGTYEDVIHGLDWSVGEIKAKLKELDLIDNTILIFTSDNGPWLVYQDHAGSAGKLREGKITVFDGGHKVPFIISWPKKIPQGQVLDGLITNMDLLPTLVSWAEGTQPSKEIDGIDVGDYLLGKNPESPRKEFLYYQNENLRGIRDERYKVLTAHKFIRPAGDPIKPGEQDRYVTDSIPLSLFDLKEDPGEQINLIEIMPVKVKELLERMEHLNKQVEQGSRKSGVYEGPEPPIGQLWAEN